MAVFIATEEALSEAGIGVDGLMDAGKLEPLKNGTVLWLDSADSQPYVTTYLPTYLPTDLHVYGVTSAWMPVQ